MGVPFVSNLSPASAPPSGGTLVRVLGGEFRTPTIPPVTNAPVPALPQTVRVEVDGVVAPKVQVANDGKLYFTAPPSSLFVAANGKAQDGPFVVDVTVTNLDDTGTPIPGETVTVSGGFTYARIDVYQTPSIVQVLTRQLLRLWKSETIPNVVDSTNTDYDGDASDGLNITALAALPAIVLTGPDLVENRFFTQNQDQICVPDVGDPLVFRRPVYTDLEFDVMLMADSKAVLLNLMSLAITFMDRNKFISIDVAGQGTLTLELDYIEDAFFDVRRIAADADNNLHGCSGRISILALPITGYAGLENDGARGIAPEVTDTNAPTLQTTRVLGDNPMRSDQPVASPPPRTPGKC